MEQDPTFSFANPLFWVGAKFVLVLQVAMAVHVVRTGRPWWWLWIIFGFPILGSLAYLYFEVLPDRRLPSWRDFAWKLKGPAGRIAALTEELEEVDTMNNRVRLAHELSLAKRFDEAAATLVEGLSAAHRDDAYVLYEYAEALLNGGHFQQAEEVISRINLKDAKELTHRRDLQMARICAGRGKAKEAEERYQKLLPVFVGESARGHYAEFLLKANRVPEARRLWAEILQNYRKSTKIWRKFEKKWFTAAKAGLKKTELLRACLKI